MKHCDHHQTHNPLPRISFFHSFFSPTNFTKKYMDLCIEWRSIQRRRDLISLRIGAWIRSIRRTIVCKKVEGGMNYHYLPSMLIVLNGERHNELTNIDWANSFSDCTATYGCIRWQPNRRKHQNTLIRSGALFMKYVAMRSDVFRFTKIQQNHYFTFRYCSVSHIRVVGRTFPLRACALLPSHRLIRPIYGDKSNQYFVFVLFSGMYLCATPFRTTETQRDTNVEHFIAGIESKNRNSDEEWPWRL